MLEKVREWVSKLPPRERTKPIIYFKGKYWTPEEILKEVEKGSKLGEELQKFLELIAGVLPYSSLGGSSVNLESMFKNVAKKRLIERLKAYMKMFGDVPILYAIDLKRITVKPSELIKMIEEERGIGREVLEIEKTKILNLLRLYR